MKRIYFIAVVLFSLLSAGTVQAQRKLTEATITYDIVINTNNTTPKAADLLDGAVSVIYLKGNSSRSEMTARSPRACSPNRRCARATPSTRRSRSS